MPNPSRLMPSPVLLVESTSSKSKPVALVLVPVTLIAGPPVALTLAVPPEGTVTVPALPRLKAGAMPDVVVRLRSVPLPSPNVVVPVVPDMLTPPEPEPVTVMSSKTLPEPMLVGVAAVPVASRPFAPALVIEMVPVGAKFVVPALLRRTPVAPLVETVRLEMLKVPVVASSSRPG